MQRNQKAFTIVELIVVISVIAILATITVVSYGAWRNSTATASLKSDLSSAAAAMESSRTFGNVYPLTLPSTFSPSVNNTVTLTVPDTKSFCIDGTTTTSNSILYYIDNLTQADGATVGTCATRTAGLPVPSAVTNVTFVAGASTITVSWAVASPNYANEYTVQCALDRVFINGVVSETAYGGDTATQIVTGTQAMSTYYCRVRAVNAIGQSDWMYSSPGNT